MHSAAILRGIIDVQAEEMTRLMSLVDHLTACLEQSQAREKAALQRCSELEIAAAAQVPAASWRAGHSLSMSLSLSPPAATTTTSSTTTAPAAVVATSEESPDARERCDTYVFHVFYVLCTYVYYVFYVFYAFYVFHVFFVCSVSNTWDISHLIP
jgi:hypothetical protein